MLNVKQYGFVAFAKGVKDNTWVTETCPASYSLEGAEFTIYNEDGKTVATDKNGNPAIVKTDKNGNAPRIELEAGQDIYRQRDEGTCRIFRRPGCKDS